MKGSPEITKLQRKAAEIGRPFGLVEFARNSRGESVTMGAEMAILDQTGVPDGCTLVAIVYPDGIVARLGYYRGWSEDAENAYLDAERRHFEQTQRQAS